MITIKFDDKAFMKKMNNVIQYSVGFIDGTKAGKVNMMENLGRTTVEMLKDFIDMSARMDPQKLHHVYEWYQTGSPNARLFDIDYQVSGSGLSINSSFRQSSSVRAGSTVPFYDKARIMENGIPVVIRPKRAKALAFDIDGETVFSKEGVVVERPGGDRVENGFEDTFKIFFDRYFNQSFLNVVGITQDINDVTSFKKYLSSGANSGRYIGYKVGYRWISNVGRNN